jgi:orotate phosphoribosyltransferase
MNTFEVIRIQDPDTIRSLVSVRASHKEIEDEILDMFAKSSALLKGHFELESMQHSNLLTHVADIADNSLYASKIAERQIAELQKDKVVIDSVLTQESAGRIIGSLIAKKLGKRLIIVETDDRNRPTLKLVNEETLYPGDNVLKVVDVSTMGSSLKPMISLVHIRRANPVAIVIFAIRNKEALSELEKNEGVRIYAMVDLNLGESTYGIPREPAGDKCMICKQSRSPSPIPSRQI